MKAVPVYKAILQITGFCFFIVLFFVAPVSAQIRGKLEVVKDARIDTFASRRADLNKANSEIAINGYRVQIFTGENRKDAYNAQAKFQEQYPNIRTYVIYSEPNFKVRAGDFRTRLEAEKLEEDLKKLFDGMFIITEKVNPPKLDSSDE